MTVGTRKVVVTVGTEVVEAGATQKIVVDMGSLPESELEKRSAQTGHMDTDFPPLPRAVQVGRRTFAAHSLEEIELLSERSEEFVGLWPFVGLPHASVALLGMLAQILCFCWCHATGLIARVATSREADASIARVFICPDCGTSFLRGDC